MDNVLTFEEASDLLNISRGQLLRLIRNAGLSEAVIKERSLIDSGRFDDWRKGHPCIIAAIEDYNNCK